MNFISAYANPTDTLVQFGIWATFGAFLITLVLITYILLYRVYQVFQFRSASAFYRVWRPLLALCPLEVPATPPAIPIHHHLRLLTLHMVLNLKQHRSRILKFMEACGCAISRQVFATILNKQPDDHLVSTALTLINDHQALPLVPPFTEHPRWHVRVQAGQALGKVARS